MAHDGRWSGRAWDALTAMGGDGGPGTESNRARAARGGFTFTMSSEPGTVIARLDTTGPEPVGSVSRDGGQTWEDAPRWPAGATTAHTATGGPVTLGASDGGGARPLPATLAEAERLYGKGSPVWEAVRWQAKQPAMEIRDVAKQDLPPMTWNGVPVPFERVDAVRAAAPQPDPAPGQVWLPPLSASGHPPGWVDIDGTVTIADSPATAVDGLYRLTRGGTVTAEVLQRGQCIGVATPNGRVMVGDGFVFGVHLATITSVSDGGHVRAHFRSYSDDAVDPSVFTNPGGWTRTRYAPARAGERYRWRATGDVETVETGPDGTLQTRSGYGVRPMRGLRGVSGVAPSFDPAQWERLDPGQDGVGQTIKIKRPASVVEAERGRAGDAATAEPDFPRATGAALDAIASHLFGIERRDGMATAYRGGTERETDEALRARCVERLRLPTLDAASRDGHAFRTEPEPQPKTAALALRAHARDLRALFDAIGRALEASAPHSATVAGRVYLVMRDEMLFLPEVAPAADVLVITADTKHLHALRRAVRDAMANGAAYRLEWGNGLTVERVGGPLVTAQPAPEPAATHYDGAQGGPDAWRWEVAE